MSLEEIISFFECPNQTPLQKIEDKITKTYQVNLYIKRLDLVHPLISGNKFYKLKHNLINAKRLNFNKLITFGGAYSNHIYAVSAAGKILGFDTIGIIRGNELNEKSSKTLEFANANGMKLHFVSRDEYRKKEEIISNFSDAYVIPEGGTNQFAIDGIKDIELDKKADFICTSFGTGGTSAGILEKYGKKSQIIAFSSLKIKPEEVRDEILKLTQINSQKLMVNTDFSFGGYGKIDSTLKEFILKFEMDNKIQLDPVYTGKMMFGVYELIKNSFFKEKQTIIVIHSGGLQGRNF
ncbi:MAG: pyridoxal-phosphate dependent enzyme [Spirosomaceae bacterium]|jgi:1-aminocyclopropane-1-carboxylate deaminase|nr:pyridoxal-phosphate dependent enzyme [Spirosomataceae bacterium]